MSKRPLQQADFRGNAKRLRAEDPPKQTSTILVDSGSDSDEDLYLCSQMVEEEDKSKRLNQPADVSIDGGYSQFPLHAAASSTQNLGHPSSQKENNFIKPPEPRQNAMSSRVTTTASDLDTVNKDLKDKNLQLLGESTLLRTKNDEMSKEITSLKRKMREQDEERAQQEKEETKRLKREIKSLQDQLSFENLNQSVAVMRGQPIMANVKPRPPYSTGIAFNLTTQSLSIPRDFFELEPPPESKYKCIAPSKIDVAAHQALMAEIQSEIAKTDVISDQNLHDLFVGVSIMIDEIVKDMADFNTSFYVSLSSIDRMKKMAFSMAMPVLRANLIDEKFSTTKAGKLFPDELFNVPRRLMGLIAIICRNSKRLAQRLLIANIKGHDKTIVGVIIELLQNKVFNSDRYCNFEGFVMSTSHLLSSLSIHADSTNNLQLFNLFEAILYCKFDNPFVMLNCAEFLNEFVHQSKNSSAFKHLFCKQGKCQKANHMRNLRLLHFPDGGCTFRLFMMYLQTSFKQSRKLNKVEIAYLQKTTFYVNSMTIRMLELDTTAFIDKKSREKICSCYHHLIDTTSLLSYMSISAGAKPNRRLYTTNAFSSIVALHELFIRIDAMMDFPVKNKFYASYLQAFCLHVKKTRLYMWVQHFKIGKKLDFINQVTYLEPGSSRDENEFEAQKPITDELEQLLTQMDNDLIMV